MLSSLERPAADDGATRLYLLTTTAESFFGRFGYAPLPRASAPAEIADSAEFRSLCPASAAFLRSEEHTSELQSLMRISYAVFCLKKKTKQRNQNTQNYEV